MKLVSYKIVKSGDYRERRNFSRIRNSYELKDLLEVQKKSYDWFISTGIKEVFDDNYAKEIWRLGALYNKAKKRSKAEKAYLSLIEYCELFFRDIQKHINSKTMIVLESDEQDISIPSFDDLDDYDEYDDLER